MKSKSEANLDDFVNWYWWYLFLEKDHSPQFKQPFATPLFYTVVTLIQVVRQDLNVNQLKLKLTASKKSDEPQKVDDLLKEQKQKK